MPDDRFQTQEEREWEELNAGVPAPSTPTYEPPSTLSEEALARAPEPVDAAPLDFTRRMKDMNVLPENWPEGVSVFQDMDLAMSSLSPNKQEVLSRELLRFLPETERYRTLHEIESASGGRIMPLSEEEWKMLTPKPKKNFLETSIGLLKDHGGGTIFGTVMDAMQYPSDRFEQIAGAAEYPLWSGRWWWDVPDGYSLWEVSSLWYDTLGRGVQANDYSGKVVKDVFGAMERGEDWNNDDPENPGIMQKYKCDWADAVGKIVLDPLWLVGGAGFIAAPLKKVPMLAKVGRLAEFGLIGGGEAPFNLYKSAKFSQAAKLPIGGRVLRMGRFLLGPEPAGERAAEKAANATMDAISRGTRYINSDKKPGFFARLFKLTPESEANTLYRKAFTTMVITSDDAKVTPKDMELFFDAIRTGDTSKLAAYMPKALAQNETAARLAEVMELHGIKGSTLNTTRKTILDPAKYDALMDEAVAKGGPTGKAAKTVVYKFSRGTDAWRHEFLNEANDHIFKSIQATYNINESDAISKLYGWNKRLLSATTLNTPSFVMLNGGNNFATMFFDHGFGIFRGGLRKSTVVEHLKNMDISDAVVTANAGDSSLGRLVGVEERVLKPGAAGAITRPSKFRLFVPFVSAATWLDGFARLKAFQVGVVRTYRHNWHGIAKPIPDALLKGLPTEMADSLYALYESSPEAGFPRMLEEAISKIKSDAPVVHVGVLREQWLRDMEKASGQKFTPEVRRLLKERFDQSGIITFMQDAMKATDADELSRNIDNIRVALQEDTDSVRKMQHLEPLGNVQDVEPIAEDAAVLTARRREIKDLVQTGAVTDPDEVARLEQEFADLDGRLRAARTAKGTTGTNLYEIGIADDELGKSRVDMTERWFNAHGVTGPGADAYIDQTRGMYMLLEGERSRIFAAHQAGERGIDKMWREYRKMRTLTTENNLKALGNLLAETNPDLLPSFRIMRDMRMNSLKGRDAALQAAFEAGEDIRYYDRAELLGPTRQRINEWVTKEIYTERDIMGLSPRVTEYNMGMYDGVPVAAEAITGENSWATEFLNWAEPKMLTMWTTPPAGIPGPLKATALGWLDELSGNFKELKMTAANVGRAMADSTMLDYNRQYGADKLLQWIMPYEFWPTRSMWRWAERTIANPGAVASLALSYEMMTEMTADLPQRFEGKFQIPVPFLGDLMKSQYGAATQIFFNPIPMMFPTMQWSQDWSMEGRQGTVAGRVLDFMSSNGPSVHPFVPMAGAAVGLLDREDWLNRNWPRALPFGIPGTTAQMGIMAFLNGADIELPSWLSDDDMGQLIGGSGLPLNKLQKVLGIPDDSWDTYRIDRMLSTVFIKHSEGMTDPVERKKLVRQFQEEADMKAGPLWDEARALASSEAGIRWLSSWAFSPITIYPEGEQMMRAMDPLYRDAAARGTLEEFYDRYPEYQIRRIASASYGGPEEREKELHQSMFWYDLGDAMDARDRELKSVNEAMEAIAQKEEFYNSKVGRTYRDLFEQEQQQVIQKYQGEINQVYARYSDVDMTPSATHPPMTRALMSLRNSYYDISLENYLPKGVLLADATPEQVAVAQEAYKKAQQDFLLDLPPGRQSATRQFSMAVQHYAHSFEASYQLNVASREGRTADIPKIIEQRDKAQQDLLGGALNLVSRYEFNLFLNRGKTPPSAVEELYAQSGREMEQYTAIGDLTNVPTKMKKALQADWWDTHPLLQRFFGNEPSGFTTSQAAAAYGRLMAIRTEYYLRDGAARLDYIYSVLDEFNSILDTLGLPVVTLEQLKIGADERQWDLAIPGIGFAPAEKLEYSISQRYSDKALSTP